MNRKIRSRISSDLDSLDALNAQLDQLQTR